ncbi:hypothetical protein [Pantoea vagans]|uniref:hypothetical protein n=1 Tax=Pantoea vagans TaxID=470934 RepID=UPI00301AD148
MVYPLLGIEMKNALAVGETEGRFDYHKSMELTGLSYRVKQQRATSTVGNHIPSFLKSK